MTCIKTARIAIGKAKAEGRAPSNDGEYITIYYSDLTGDIIAENNAGTFSLDDEGLNVDGLDYDEEAELRDEWNEIRAEVERLINGTGGEPLKSCGYEARGEMIALGWATMANFEGTNYFGEGL